MRPGTTWPADAGVRIECPGSRQRRDQHMQRDVLEGRRDPVVRIQQDQRPNVVSEERAEDRPFLRREIRAEAARVVRVDRVPSDLDPRTVKAGALKRRSRCLSLLSRDVEVDPEPVVHVARGRRVEVGAPWLKPLRAGTERKRELLGRVDRVAQRYPAARIVLRLCGLLMLARLGARRHKQRTQGEQGNHGEDARSRRMPPPAAGCGLLSASTTAYPLHAAEGYRRQIRNDAVDRRYGGLIALAA